MPSTITSLTVLGPGVLPDGADAAVPNGWVAVATLPDDGVSVFNPKKIVLPAKDAGFSGPGVAATQTRLIRGTEIVRRQMPNQAQRLNSASAGVRTVYFALSEEIYAGTVIEGAYAEAGYYGAAAEGSIAGVVNNSTLAYPVPLIAWLNLQHERATGAGFAVEAAVYHDLARNGQQVAGVEFWGRDAQATPNLTPVQQCAQPSLSDLQTGGQRVEAWKATIPLGPLTQGDLCQVVAKVYPWIGPAFDVSVAGTGVYGTVTPGAPVDTPVGATPLRFVCDKTGGYGDAHFAVKAGATGGAVQSSYALAVTTPFPTIGAGIAALPAWNNANKGHNDHSAATGWLMDDGAGGAVDHAIQATSATAAGKCWTDIRVDPAATGQVRVAITATGLIGTADLLRFRCPIFLNASGNTALDGGSVANVKRIAFDGATMIGGGTNPATPFTYRFGLAYWRNVTFSNFPGSFSPYSTERTTPALVLGCTGTLVGTAFLTPYQAIGNNLPARTVETSGANHFAHDGGVLANNILRATQAQRLGNPRALNGFARVQNVFEPYGYSNSQGYDIGGDNQVSPISGLISMHNTIPGVGVGSSNIGRQNAVYADTAASVGVQKAMTEKFDLLHQRNIKTDTFTNAGALAGTTGRTGNWKVRYGVGQLGLVVVTGDAQGGMGSAADPSGGTGQQGQWSGEYVEPGSTLTAGEANVTFVDNKAGSAGAGGGNYRLTGATNAAYGRVPAGRGVLRYDLAGVLRRQDGTGAAGAYERTDNPPIAGAGGGALGEVAGSGAARAAVAGGGGGQLGSVDEAGAGKASVAGGGGGQLGSVGEAGAGKAAVQGGGGGALGAIAQTGAGGAAGGVTGSGGGAIGTIGEAGTGQAAVQGGGGPGLGQVNGGGGGRVAVQGAGGGGLGTVSGAGGGQSSGGAAWRLVELPEAKLHLRVDLPDDDDLIDLLIDVATEAIESDTGWVIRAREVVERFDSFGAIRLRSWPITAVAGVAYRDPASGDLTTVDPAAYRLDAGRRPVRLGWFSAAPRCLAAGDAVEVTVQAGHANRDDVPKRMRAAALLMIGDLYAQRETFVNGASSTAVPMSLTVDRLLQPFRVITL